MRRVFLFLLVALVVVLASATESGIHSVAYVSLSTEFEFDPIFCFLHCRLQSSTRARRKRALC
jgi:hypothetical protein